MALDRRNQRRRVVAEIVKDAHLVRFEHVKRDAVVGVEVSQKLDDLIARRQLILKLCVQPVEQGDRLEIELVADWRLSWWETEY
jgi:hypothetical protein